MHYLERVHASPGLSYGLSQLEVRRGAVHQNEAAVVAAVNARSDGAPGILQVQQPPEATGLSSGEQQREQGEEEGATYGQAHYRIAPVLVWSLFSK